ncbi:MAG: hypothetical protein HY537_00100 [Deltaproteobacteria bacterium]|nr:hypothetical protein [Deltaproteobacteria bacterium]
MGVSSFWTMVLILFVVHFSSASANHDRFANHNRSANQAPKDWTILLFVAGDESDIRRPILSMLKRLEHMESLRNNKQVNIIVQHDDVGEDENPIYEIRYLPKGKRTKKLKLDGKPIKLNGELDSGNPRTLKRFLLWAVTHYPAKQYALVFAGHSWGILGIFQDFFVRGEKLDISTIVKHYEVRRVLEEVYSELKALSRQSGFDYLPTGKFSTLLIDACINGQLDILYEYAELFDYLGASTLETPDNGFPFSRILDRFVGEANRPGISTGTPAFIEDHLLKPFVRFYEEDHGPDGPLAKEEKQIDVVTAFALRTQKLEPVVSSLENFVRGLPPTLKKEWSEGKWSDLDALSDADSNADLFQFAEDFPVVTKDEHVPTAVHAANQLRESLGYPAKDHALKPTAIRHDKAQGAWVHVEIDSLVRTRELAACIALTSLASLNRNASHVIPKFLESRKEIPSWKIACNELQEHAGDTNRKQRRVKEPIAERPEAVTNFFGIDVQWPTPIPAYVSEISADRSNNAFDPDSTEQIRRDQETLSKRWLSFWVPKGDAVALSFQLRLRLVPATQHIVVDYLNAGIDPKSYLDAEHDWLRPQADREITPTEPFVYIDTFSPDALYVAEAHSSGTLFKHGLGIYLTRKPANSPYLWGYRPVERLGSHFGGIDEYFGFLHKAKKKETEKFVVRGNDFLRLHRIERTGWYEDFLFYE